MIYTKLLKLLHSRCNGVKLLHSHRFVIIWIDSRQYSTISRGLDHICSELGLSTIHCSLAILDEIICHSCVIWLSCVRLSNYEYNTFFSHIIMYSYCERSVHRVLCMSSPYYLNRLSVCAQFTKYTPCWLSSAFMAFRIEAL